MYKDASTGKNKEINHFYNDIPLFSDKKQSLGINMPNI